MNEPTIDSPRTCTCCFEMKKPEEFYKCSGILRGECKKCTSVKRSAYEKKTKPWLTRIVDKDARRAYHRAYYAKNKDRFAEHRKTFKEKYPTYYQDYRNKDLP